MPFIPITDIKVQIEDPQQKVVNTQNNEDILSTFLATECDTEAFVQTYDPESAKLDSLLETIEQLFAFNMSIKRYGLTRSLVSFADHNTNLSRSIPQVPSLENLSSDRSVKNSTDVVVAVEASIRDSIDLFVRKLAARAKNFIDRIKFQAARLNATKLHINTVKKMFDEGRVLDEEQLKTRTFKLLNRDELLRAFKNIEMAAQFSQKITSMKLPDGESEYQKWLSEIQSLFEPLGHELHVSLEDRGLSFDDIEKSSLPTKRTLTEHGYTSIEDINLIAVEYPKVEKLVLEYNGHLNRVASMLGHNEHDPTMKYLHRSSETIFNTLFILADWSVWVMDKAAFNVLKALFACSKKSNNVLRDEQS